MFSQRDKDCGSTKKRKHRKARRKRSSSGKRKKEHELRYSDVSPFDNEIKMEAFLRMIDQLQQERNSDEGRLNKDEKDRHFIPSYDDVIHRYLPEGKQYTQLAEQLSREKKEAVTEFHRYPRDNFAPLQYWEKDLPVYDLALFRTAHFFDKYKRIPTSLFWTNFESQELMDRHHPSTLENDKYENLEGLLQDLMDLDLRVCKPGCREEMGQEKLKQIMGNVFDDD